LQEIPLVPPGTGTLTVAWLTDVGCVRKNNEDAQGIFPGHESPKGSLIVLADGMGGAAAGEVASQLAVETVGRSYYAEPSSSPGDSLRAAIEAANAAIYGRAAEDPKLGGMGTTCTAIAVVGREIWYGHVGDSRAYVVAGQTMTQITRDHSLAAEYERTGGEGGAPARARNVLTRCLGVKPEVKVDVPEEPIRLEDDGVIVTCSDGLSNQVDDGEIFHVVSMHLPDGACKRLVQLAKERGGPDNITVQVARLSVAGV
jgi:serine/threonine protein phosphatase PrpC